MKKLLHMLLTFFCCFFMFICIGCDRKASGIDVLRGPSASFEKGIFTISYENFKDFLNVFLVKQLEVGTNQSININHNSSYKAQSHITYDNEGMHFKVNVKDLVFSQPFTGEEIWKGDSLQMAFDVNLDRTDAYDENDYEYGFSYIEETPYIHIWKEYPELFVKVEEIDYRFTPKKQGMEYVIDLPWDALYPLTASNLHPIGFDFMINNTDNLGQRQFYYSWRNGLKKGKIPSEFGILVFDEKDKNIGAVLTNLKETCIQDEELSADIYIPSFSNKYNSVHYSFSLNGKDEYTEAGNMPIQKGENHIQLKFSSNILDIGKNSAVFKLFAEPGHVMIMDNSMDLTKLSFTTTNNEINQIVRSITDNLQDLDDKLKQFEKLTEKPAEIIASREIAKLFLQYIPVDVLEKRERLALKEAKAIDTIIKRAIEDLNSGRFHLVQSKTVRGIHNNDGVFCNNKFEPVFLRGFVGNPADICSEEGSRVIRNLGVNLIGVSVTSPQNLFTSEFATKERKENTFAHKYLKAALDNNALIDFSFNFYKFPDWFIKKYPEANVGNTNHFFPIDPDHPGVRKLIEANIEWFMDGLCKEDRDVLDNTVLGMDLANEPEFQSVTQYTLQNIHVFLEKKYQNIDALNKSWGTNYEHFTVIGVKDIPKILGSETGFYDWYQFNSRRFIELFRWIRDIIRKNAKDIPVNTHIKVASEKTWSVRGYEYKGGVEREGLTDVTEIIGCDTRITAEETDEYIVDWLGQSLSFDFYKSIAPDKPIYDSEWHSVDTVQYKNPDIPDGHMRLALRLATWHGLAASKVWTFTRPDMNNSSWFNESVITAQPHVLNEYVQESIGIDAELDRITSFYQSDRDVYILYSLNSALYDRKKYLNVLQDIYQAFYFRDLHIGFITERMLENPELLESKKMRLLILPNARFISEEALNEIRKLSQTGTKIVVIGDAPSFNKEREELGKETELTGEIKKMNLSSLDEYAAACEDILRWSGIQQQYSLTTIAGEYPQYIEARFADYHNKPIGYAVNLGKHTQTFSVVNREGSPMNLGIYKWGKVIENKSSIELAPREFVSFDVLQER